MVTSMAKKPESLASICSQNQQLNFLSQRANQLIKLNSVLQQVIPAKFTQHCRLANISGERVIIHVDNASIASLLRFQSAAVCKVLSEHISTPVSKLEVKVRPNLAGIQHLTQSIEPLSDNASAVLKQTADLLEDGSLKTALTKLARRNKSN
jgi:hypothetical protein